MYQVNFNRYDNLADKAAANKRMTEPTAKPNPPTDIHGSKIFLVKIQTMLNKQPGMPEGIYIYDKQKSFEGYLLKEDDGEGYAQAEEETKRTGWRGIKMYRWARRVGDWELSICLDKAPEKNPEW